MITVGQKVKASFAEVCADVQKQTVHMKQPKDTKQSVQCSVINTGRYRNKNFAPTQSCQWRLSNRNKPLCLLTGAASSSSLLLLLSDSISKLADIIAAVCAVMAGLRPALTHPGLASKHCET